MIVHKEKRDEYYCVTATQLTDKEKDEILKKLLGQDYYAAGKNLPLLQKIIGVISDTNDIATLAEIIPTINTALASSRLFAIVSSGASVTLNNSSPMLKHTAWTIILYSSLSLLPLLVGLYVLIEKKMIIGGRLAPGEVYELAFPANIIMATSFFLFSALILLALIDGKHIKKISVWIFFTALLLFITGAFI